MKITVNVSRLAANQWDAAILQDGALVHMERFTRFMDAVNWVNARLEQMAIEAADKGI